MLVLDLGAYMLNHSRTFLWMDIDSQLHVTLFPYRYGITDMAGAAAGRTRTRMTQSGHTVSHSIISSARELDRRGLRVVAMIC
jgi:hypothetical protein